MKSIRSFVIVATAALLAAGTTLSAAAAKLMIGMLPKAKGNAYFISCKNGADKAAKFLTATDEADALALLTPDKAKYVVVDWELPFRDAADGSLAGRFESIADWIVPHVKGRPLTLVHCPAGLAAPCLYLKHAKQWGPSALRRVRIQEKTKIGEYLVANNIEAVVSLAQMGIVEIHTWNSTADDVERPSRIVWDLDPGPQVGWKQVVTAAQLGAPRAETLGLTSWVRTANRSARSG